MNHHRGLASAASRATSWWLALCVALATACGAEEAAPAPEPECNHSDCDNQHAPEIASIEPAVCNDESCLAPTASTISVRFSEPIDPAVAAGGRADCAGFINAWPNAAGAPPCIEGTVTVTDTTLLLTPHVPLQPGTQYHVHVSEMVRDLSGAPMGMPFDWTFTTQSTPVCGNGELSPDEVCDDGNVMAGDYCAADCSAVTGECGDGVLQPTLEACDDANEAPLDGCSPRCTLEIVQPKVVPGLGASCGLRRDGSILCWGGPLDDAPDGVFEDVAVGDASACALTRVNMAGMRDLVCWGASNLWMTVPLTGIVAAGNQVCGLGMDGNATCYALDATAAPFALPAGPYVQLVVERAFACGIRADGSVGCAGTVPPPIASATGITDLATGNGFACVLRTTGAVECQGLAGSGVLPVEAPPGPFVAIDAAPASVCGLLMRGDMSCWRITGGAAVAPGGTFADFALGDEHGCGITTAGTAQCWTEDVSEATLVPEDFP